MNKVRLNLLIGLGLAASISTAAYADDRSEICVRGHSQTLRLHGPEYYALRNAAFARAGVSVSRQCHEDKTRGLPKRTFDKLVPLEKKVWSERDSLPECYVVDHVLPLELCLASDNCNSLDNIQIQTRAEAAEKDRIENRERARYCRGEETLDQAVSHFTRSVP